MSRKGHTCRQVNGYLFRLRHNSLMKENTRTGFANPLIVASDDKQSGEKLAGLNRQFFGSKLFECFDFFFSLATSHSAMSALLKYFIIDKICILHSKKCFIFIS